MIQYRCSQCKTTYNRREYDALDHVQVIEDEDDPTGIGGHGYERVCECGARFHSDKWQLLDEVTVDGETFHISTVGLLIPHGTNHDQWYETLVSHDTGNTITDRYETEDEARAGHERVLERLRIREFTFETTGRRLTME